MSFELPPWVLLHIPHNSTVIPSWVREQFVLDDHQLQREVLQMTDHHTEALFTRYLSSHHTLVSPVSRLVVDVERFPVDADEPMSAVGMGAIYMSTHEGQNLRRDLTKNERQYLLEQWYHPHHSQLESITGACLQDHGRCLIIDCHSYPANALPYELNQAGDRPQICIGSDANHTPPKLTQALLLAAKRCGWTAAVNTPFVGALVPLRYYRQNTHVHSVMIEVRRDVYMNEQTGEPLDDFDATAQALQSMIAEQIQ
jgi:N-formylglutamate deformylase